MQLSTHRRLFGGSVASIFGSLGCRLGFLQLAVAEPPHLPFVRLEFEPRSLEFAFGVPLHLLAFAQLAGLPRVKLSEAYSRPHTDRAGLCNQIEKALRLTDAVPAAFRQRPRRDNEIKYQTKFIYLRDISLST
jgi:hypothetical protein